MKTTDMRKLTAADIDKKVLELKEQLFDLKFKAALGQLDHPHKIKQIRKTIARLKTIQSENKV